MTIPIRHSTASQEVPLGYFLDSTDGDTEETGLTISNTDIKLWKMGATTLTNKNSGGATHISNGLYYCVLDATDSNTLGSLIIFIHEAGSLPIRIECTVYPAHVYDSLIAGTDKLEVDVVQLNNVAQSLVDLKDFADVGYDPANNKVEGVKLVDTTTTNTDMVGTDSAYTGTPPTVTEIKTKVEEVGSKLATIETDTNALQTDLVDGGRLDLFFDRILKATEIRQGTVASAGATTTVFVSSLTEDVNDFWNRTAIRFTSGQCEGQIRKIHDYNGASKEITLYTALSYAPANGDTFIVIAARNFRTNIIDNNAIADQVCDELLGDHTTDGSLAKGISDVLTDTDDLQGNQTDWATATGFALATVCTETRLAELDAANIPADVDTIAIDVAGLDGDVMRGTDSALTDKTEFSLSEAGVDAVLDEVVEGTITLRQAQRVELAVLAGKSSGGGTTVVKFRDTSDTKDRIQATVDEDGNRTDVSISET